MNKKLYLGTNKKLNASWSLILEITMDYNTPQQQENLPPQEPNLDSQPVVEPTPKTFNKNFYIALGILIAIGILGVGGLYWYSNAQNKKLASNSTQNPNSQTEVKNPASPTGTLAEVKDVFDKINAAKDEATFKLYLSKSSVDALAQMNQSGFTNTFTNNHLTYISAKLSADGKTATVIASEQDKDNQTQEQKLIFVLENGEWKFDLGETINQEFDQASAEYDKVAANPNGVAGTGTTDLAVLDFVVTPNPPNASDKNITLEARIKNVGQTTLSKFSGRGAIDDFDFPINYQGIIKPGEIIRTDIVPYQAYLFDIETKHQTVTPGAHTLSINIDNENKLGDANKSNNTLTQTVIFK